MASPIPAPVKLMPFYLGTYTAGESRGIYKYTLSSTGTLEKIGLMAEAENPSFLGWSPGQKTLLAVNEVKAESGQGYVSSYIPGQDTLVLKDQKPSGGPASPHKYSRSYLRVLRK